MGGKLVPGLGDSTGKQPGDEFLNYVITEHAATLFPKAAHDAYWKSREGNVATAYAKHPSLGRAVIAMATSGPYILWAE